VLHSLAVGPRREELAGLLSPGPPEGARLDRAIEIIRADGSLAHSRAAVTAEVGRAVTLARRLPPGTARTALIRLANFLALRCGAGQAAA
jgi:geranylgeranyl pyrophosphate synthase